MHKLCRLTGDEIKALVPVVKSKEYADYAKSHSQEDVETYLIEELGLYRWKVDKYGNPLEIPEDKNNHRIDAIRYGSDDLYLAS